MVMSPHKMKMACQGLTKLLSSKVRSMEKDKIPPKICAKPLNENPDTVNPNDGLLTDGHSERLF